MREIFKPAIVNLFVQIIVKHVNKEFVQFVMRNIILIKTIIHAKKNVHSTILKTNNLIV